jgi:tripeptidyl-peptidase-2
MDVTIRDGRNAAEDGEAATRLFVLHTVQLLPHAAYRDNAQQKYLHLLPSQTSINSIAVESEVTCEVDIGRYWSTAGVSKADVTIEFRGVRPVPSELSLRSGDSFGLVRVQSDLRDEDISPAAKLIKWKTPLRPKSEGVISPLGERDIQPWNDKKTYQLALHYEFSQDEKGSFTPLAPVLQGVLYESVYESQLMLAYDGDQKYLGYCGM